MGGRGREGARERERDNCKEDHNNIEGEEVSERVVREFENDGVLPLSCTTV